MPRLHATPLAPHLILHRFLTYAMQTLPLSRFNKQTKKIDTNPYECQVGNPALLQNTKYNSDKKASQTAHFS